MFEFLKKLFETPQKMGALLNPQDPRDVPVSALPASEASVPNEYVTDVSELPRWHQMNNDSCVGHAHSQIIKYFDLKEGLENYPSPRGIYALSKMFDNYPGGGTYPRVTAENSKDIGNPTTELIPNDNTLPHSEYIDIQLNDELRANAKPHRTEGYAFVSPDATSLKKAIIEYGLVEITVPVGYWGSLPVKSGSNGYHRVVLYGFSGNLFFFLNSWGPRWGNHGTGYFEFQEFSGKIYDAMVYTDIPTEILEEYKEKWPYKYFQPWEVEGLKPEFITMLDKGREASNMPWVITSGFRTEEENRRVGGSPTSHHLYGTGADIRARNWVEVGRVVDGARHAGITGITVYVNSKHVHLDLKPYRLEVVYKPN